MNEREFRDFFHLMHPKLVHYAARSVDVETANEIAIDALRTIWMKGCPHPKTEVKRRQLMAFSYRISDGLISNALRSTVRRTALVTAAASTAAHQTSTPDIADGIVDRLGDLATVAGLTEAERGLLRLLVDGYKVAEIAEILGISSAAVSMRIARAKKALRRHVEESKGASE